MNYFVRMTTTITTTATRPILILDNISFNEWLVMMMPAIAVCVFNTKKACKKYLHGEASRNMSCLNFS